jgi:Arc/MetJ-type ribon-helix-helix transcriptional regulator
MRDEQLTVNLSDDHADFVREQVERRGDGTAADVVGDALDLLQKRERDLARLRAALDKAAADPRRYSIEEVEARFRKRFSESEAAE